MREEFWKHYALSELNTKEWEALCDGCGQCCLVRHVSEHEVSVFNIACELLDIEHSRCSDYHNRLEKCPTATPSPQRQLPNIAGCPNLVLIGVFFEAKACLTGTLY